MKVGADNPRVLVWSLGRRGAAPTHTLMLVRELMRRQDLVLTVGISRQSARYEETKALGLPLLGVSTYPSDAKPMLLPTLWRLPWALIAFAIFLRKHRINVVFCPFSHPWNVFFVQVLRLLGCRYVLKVHDGAVHVGDDMSSPQRLIDMEIRRADALVLMTDHVKQQLISRLGCDERLMTVAPMGPYGLTHFMARSLDVTPTNLLFFGRIMAYKGLENLLAAYQLLRQTHPTLTLSIVGFGDFRRYVDAVSRLPGVHSDIRFIPEIEIAGIFEAADIVVLPYQEATQSGVVSLAHEAGVPVVATPVGGLKEQIEDGETGILAEDVSPQAIARAIDRLLGDPNLCRKISKSAHAKCQNLWSNAAEKISTLICQVADSGRVSFWVRGQKRIFDIALAVCALAIMSPFMVLIAVLVRTSLGAPVFFRQSRPGCHGRLFTLLKFRTMTNARDLDGGLLSDAQRLSSFGRFLRTTSLDELPELWNILRGDMSFVGPRPLLPDYLPYYTASEAARHKVRPGLTGWAQVNGRNMQTWEERFALDLYYVRNCSFLLDVEIILRTIWQVLSLRGTAAENHPTMPRFDDEVRARRASAIPLGKDKREFN